MKSSRVASSRADAAPGVLYATTTRPCPPRPRSGTGSFYTGHGGHQKIHWIHANFQAKGYEERDRELSSPSQIARQRGVLQDKRGRHRAHPAKQLRGERSSIRSSDVSGVAIQRTDVPAAHIRSMPSGCHAHMFVGGNERRLSSRERNRKLDRRNFERKGFHKYSVE